jgi:hypothetical protein
MKSPDKLSDATAKETCRPVPAGRPFAIIV